MKAAFIRETGPADNIIVDDLPRPGIEGSQVLVRVQATAVNPVDTYLRAGLTPFELTMPYIVGCDLAGVVEEVGPDATRFSAGDRVWGTSQGLLGRQGTTAEYAAVEEEWLQPIPDDIDAKDAAALALVGITAHLGLYREGRLAEGQTLFVNGGTGGVGSSVVQMGRITGARVITTAGSVEKAEKASSLGANHVVLYQEQDVTEAVRELAPEGVDLWYETLREPAFAATIPLLKPRGRMIVMAGRDATPVFPVGPFYTRDCKLLGFAMYNATADEQRICAQDINRWLSQGKLCANIDRVLPIEETANAHRLQEGSTVEGSGALAGKLVITV